MKISIPELSLVALVGASGSGKSSFAARHFKRTETISSDFCRGLVSDDENDQSATVEAFDLLHTIAGKRLARGLLTVIDATNVQQEARKPLVALAREYHCLPVAIVFNLPAKICQQRNESRADRSFGPHVIRQQTSDLRRAMKNLRREGFRHVFILNSEEEVNQAEVDRTPLWNNRKTETGPFDIIGDVHGCCDELEELLAKLGYEPAELNQTDAVWGVRSYRHPAGRKVIFLGDLVDRGPKILDTIRIARNMVADGAALCVPGNHDIKLLKKLRGKDVRITHGLETSLAQIEHEPEDVRPAVVEELSQFIDGLVSHYVLDGGKLVVAHAGMKQEMQGRGSGKVRDFALYGETTGETDVFGLPVRLNWAADYRGAAMVVYGHTPVPMPEWLNRTVNIDTGCVFGGGLTALRYPEREFVTVPAKATYWEPVKPFLAQEEQAPRLSAQQVYDDVLELEDVIGKRIVSTRLKSNVIIRQENATAALEVISRFAVDPKWLVYLPPTMSPCATAPEGDLLERPAEAYEYFRASGVAKVMLQEKHMGSRAVAVALRSPEVAVSRFGVAEEAPGIIYTRTGRRFFDNLELETILLGRLRSALDSCGFWEKHQTDWALFDCELMPWSAKAQSLIRNQYAAVGASASAALAMARNELTMAMNRADIETGFTNEGGSTKPADAGGLSRRIDERMEAIRLYTQAYSRYCWQVNGIEDLKLAPFHLMATEGNTHVDKDHAWHMEAIREICQAGGGPLMATRCMEVDLTSAESMDEGTRWWQELTGAGGEGMVVKPMSFIVQGHKGLAQPAVKVRGREYLRIIYGPEYTAKENMERLRPRSLAAKRSIALREFALGVEGLERFVRREPLRRVHECVFGVLAMESEPVDPRL